MNPHVLKSGKDAAGLTRYLFGPGKANEHTNQRMLAGSPELMGEWAGSALTMAEATHLGRVVEASWRRQYAPELAMAGASTGGISRENLRADVETSVDKDHVFHVTISLHPDEGPYTDPQWREVATKYMEAMGFTGVKGRADASWYAVHHGRSVPLDENGNKDPSKPGNDHIHIVACTMLRDGTRINIHNSGRRSQQVRRDVLEKLDFVTPMHELKNRAKHTPSTRAYTAAEHNIAAQRARRGEGPATPDRVLLQRIVRAAAAEANTEAGFINNVIKNPQMEIVAARWKPGTDKQEVTGYKIRFARPVLDPSTGERVIDPETGKPSKDGIWFSATQLSPDLTLGKLRRTWTGEDDASRSYARALWAEQALGEKRQATADVPVQLERAAAALDDVNTTLEGLSSDNVAAWNDVEAALAGATAVVATAAPNGVDQDGRATGFGVEAGRASDVLTRQWLSDNYNRLDSPAPRVPSGLSGLEVATRHIQLAIRANSTDRHQGWLAVIQQMARTMDAIARAKQARGEAIAAAMLRRDAMTAMSRLEDWLGTRVEDPTTAPTTGQPSNTEAPVRTQTAPTEAAQRALDASAHGRVDKVAETAATFPGPVTYRDGTPYYPSLSKEQALAHIAKLASDPNAGPGGSLDSWKGRDAEVDRALATKFPRMFSDQERRAALAAPLGAAARVDRGADPRPGQGPRRRF